MENQKKPLFWTHKSVVILLWVVVVILFFVAVAGCGSIQGFHGDVHRREQSADGRYAAESRYPIDPRLAPGVLRAEGYREEAFARAGADRANTAVCVQDREAYRSWCVREAHGRDKRRCMQALAYSVPCGTFGIVAPYGGLPYALAAISYDLGRARGPRVRTQAGGAR